MFCQCGCGSKTGISKWNRPSEGYSKGQHFRFLKGHGSRIIKPLLERGLHKIEPKTGCWVWTGIIDKHGYAQVTLANKTRLAHRAFFENAKGKIPEGLTLDHLCKNKRCVNPSHLEPVTNKENVRRGAKLNKQKVNQIRNLFKGGMQQKDLAKMFSVTQANISCVCRNVTWVEVA